MQRLDDLQFKGLKMYQESDGYCFTTDSVLLANFAKFLPGSKVVEFCAGSGVISILLSKKQKPKCIHAYEIMPKPFKLLQKNIKLNELKELVFAHNKPLEESVTELGVGFADVIVCNPPYFCSGDKQQSNDEKTVATNEILTNLESIVKTAGQLLKYGGKLFMIHRIDRMVDVLTCLRLNGIEPKRLSVVYPKEDAEPVVFLVEATKAGKKGLRVSRAVFANKTNRPDMAI